MRYFAIFIVCLCLFLLPLQLIKQKDTKLTSVIEKECSIEIKVEGYPDPYPLDEYIIGVVSAEMPTSFHLEALKAQAIAARTFALKTTNYGAEPIKPTVAHQAFIPEGKQANNENVRKAVAKRNHKC
jgi:stage II sporulation protein D